ncbi:hypothetical protein CY34DRAFT_312965 [Suillus luteus UH-Slu-Lm8-n1]|uniref:Uncharacterized protein n=1 Tax=Suillus luteus UH-Slu-Lm8-n1 TaxID=930992 RepID=A0A0D0C3A3_9AGAM|nr:hypothetical protein CY34DRAFT_312965 [Suillus luteus UH-Slu-Lm8-n1]
MTLVLLQKGAPLAYRLSLDLVQITYQHWIGSSMFNKPFFKSVVPDLWITPYYYPATMAVQFDALRRAALRSVFLLHAYADSR